MTAAAPIVDVRDRLPRWYRWRDRTITAIAWIVFLSLFDVIPLFFQDLLAVLGPVLGFDSGYRNLAGEHLQILWSEILHLLRVAGWAVGMLAAFGLYNLYVLIAMRRERHDEPAETTRDAVLLGVDPAQVDALRREPIVTVGFDAAGHIASLRAGSLQRSKV
jgi:poly-beta-1,6-N-acetyl-D-glucosamine biosynthesis protein PgaD